MALSQSCGARAIAVEDDAPGRTPTPRRLGHYELLQPLAVGGMAELRLARVTGVEGFAKLVVVKRPLPHLARRPDVVRLFLREARLAATLDHPNIAQVYDVGVIGDDYFFSMEYVPGQDLRAVAATALRIQGGVPLAEAIAIMLGACAGLHYAHEMVGLDGQPLGIVHRDVSPSNILVGYHGCTKVVDFGIADAVHAPGEDHEGVLRGKTSYLSPEQCRGETVDRRSDVFSLGVVLFELTTGRRPFRAPSEVEILRRIAEEDPPAPGRIRAGYPRQLEAIVLKALARRREDRYPTVAALQLDLEDFARQRKLVVTAAAVARLMTRLFPAELAAARAVRAAGSGPSASSPPAATGGGERRVTAIFRGGRRSRGRRALLAAAAVVLGAVLTGGTLGAVSRGPGRPRPSRELAGAVAVCAPGELPPCAASASCPEATASRPPGTSAAPPPRPPAPRATSSPPEGPAASPPPPPGAARPRPPGHRSGREPARRPGARGVRDGLLVDVWPTGAPR